MKIKLNAYYFSNLENLIADYESYGYKLIKIRPSKWFEGGLHTAIMIFIPNTTE